MRIQDEDDDDTAPWRGRRADRGSFDEDPDAADIADEYGGVKCLHCGRAIHEDADMCPYCKHWQTDENHPPRKPLWFVVTVILLVGAFTGVLWIVLSILFRGRP
jgi:RNA polymerase subunit RPABC4/transcription elongation factor Spt4